MSLNGEALRSRIILNVVEAMDLSPVADPVSHTALVFPIPHPEPRKIDIVRVLGRVHLHAPFELPGANEFSIALFRQSDFSLLGGAVFETTVWKRNAFQVSVDRVTDWSPNYFRLEMDDSLVAVLTAFGESDAAHRANVKAVLGGFIAIAYVPHA